jgi:hypothetical protein
MRRFVAQVCYRLIFFTALGLVGWIAANQARPGDLTLEGHTPVAWFGRVRLTVQSLRTAADDGLPYFSPPLETIAVPLFSSASLILTYATPGRAEREPLSLTQRRRE